MPNLSDAQLKMVAELTKQFVDQGKLVEAGFGALRILAIPQDASATQVAEMRKAFMMGAQHLFASIMTVLSPDAEPTADDMRMMTLIHNELEAFKMEVTSEHRPGHS